MKVVMTLDEAFEVVNQRFIEVRTNFESLKGFTDAVTDGMTKLSNQIIELKGRIAELERIEDERAYHRAEGIE